MRLLLLEYQALVVFHYHLCERVFSPVATFALRWRRQPTVRAHVLFYAGLLLDSLLRLQHIKYELLAPLMCTIEAK